MPPVLLRTERGRSCLVFFFILRLFFCVRTFFNRRLRVQLSRQELSTMQRLLCNENSTTGSREGRRKRSSGHTRYLPACLPRLLGLLRRITYLADITGEENETAKRNGRHLLLLLVVVVSVSFLFLFESQRFVFCSHMRKRSFLSRQCVRVCVSLFLSSAGQGRGAEPSATNGHRRERRGQW